MRVRRTWRRASGGERPVTALEVVEVGPRDGLQNAPRTLSQGQRAEMISRLARAGVPRIEAVSFVRADRVPQMADAELVLEKLPASTLDRSCGLVLNRAGLARLSQTRLPAVRFTFAVSDEFNRRNSNASTEQGLRDALAIVDESRSLGLRVGVVLATAFACPFTGLVDPGRTLAVAESISAAGVDELVFADTVGAAVPREIRAVLQEAQGLPARLGVHLHNTRSTGYANAYAALEAGATVFDASIGGLGGCPFAPGATGNIATEDLIYLLEREGIDTGVDLDALIDTALWIRQDAELALESQLHRAGYEPYMTNTARDRGHDVEKNAGR